MFTECLETFTDRLEVFNCTSDEFLVFSGLSLDISDVFSDVSGCSREVSDEFRGVPGYFLSIMAGFLNAEVVALAGGVLLWIGPDVLL